MQHDKLLISKSAYNKLKNNAILVDFREKYSFNDRYEVLENLGESVHGLIYKVIKRDSAFKNSNGIKFAAKPYRYTETLKTIGYKLDFVEVDLLARIEHPNILKISDIVYNKSKNVLYTIANVYTNSLSEYISNNMPLNNKIRISHEIISSIKFLYDNNITLLDLNVKLYNMMDINPNSTILSKLKNINRHDTPLSYKNLHDKIKNITFKPPEIMQVYNEDVRDIFQYKNADEILLKSDKLQFTMFMLGLILYAIFYPNDFKKLRDDASLISMLKSIKNQKTSFSSNISDELNNLLRYTLHYDPERRYASFDKILELPLFSNLGFEISNKGTNYVLPIIIDTFPQNFFQEYIYKIEKFALEYKISTFILGNAFAMYMQLVSKHLINNLSYDSVKELCKSKSSHALAISTLISTEINVSLVDIFKFFYAEDSIVDNNKYNLFLTDLQYNICEMRGITMESTYYYSPNYQIFYKSLVYYNKGKTSVFLVTNSSPDNFISNLIKNHIVDNPTPKYQIFDTLPIPVGVYSAINYTINEKVEDDQENHEIEFENEKNNKIDKIKLKSTSNRVKNSRKKST